MKEDHDDISKAINQIFEKEGLPLEHFPVFDEVFRFVLKNVSAEAGLDPISHSEALLDIEDPDHGTWRTYLNNKSVQLFRYYTESLQNKHSKNFAKAYVYAMNTFDDARPAIAEAYAALSSSRYAEAVLWSLRDGKSEAYANFFARELVSGLYDTDIFALFKIAERYAVSVDRCLKSGFSVIYAHAFAEQFGRLTTEAADVYAKCYEMKLNEGLSHREASRYADTYTEETD